MAACSVVAPPRGFTAAGMPAGLQMDGRPRVAWN